MQILGAEAIVLICFSKLFVCGIIGLAVIMNIHSM